MMSYVTAEPASHISRHPNHPYSPSLASSASSSASSIFSLAPSVSSAASSVISSQSSVHISQPSWDIKDGNRHTHPVPQRTQAPVPIEQRKHPRRSNRMLDNNHPSCTSSEACTMPSAPPLVREIERKVNFVDNLVDVAAQIVEVIWPAYMKSESSGGKGVLPLRTFIQETLKRSRTSYSTLQVALYYLIIIRPAIGKPIPSELTPDIAQRMRALQCGRRMFLAALILASKYLQDRNYSARAWSRISGLQTTEININEMAFLEAVGWRLHVSETNFLQWTELVTVYAGRVGPPGVNEMKKQEWRQLVLKLSSDLREAWPILEAKREADSAKKAGVENGVKQFSLSESFDVRITTPRTTTNMVTLPIHKVTVSSLLSDRPPAIDNVSSTVESRVLQTDISRLENSTFNSALRLTCLPNLSPLKTPAARIAVGTNAMACAAATAQLGQLQRCATDDITILSSRTTLRRRSSLSASISSSPEAAPYSDSSANSSPSRFPHSRSSSISSASSIDSIIPQSLAGKKFSRVPINCDAAIPEADSPSIEIPSVAHISLSSNFIPALTSSPFRLNPAIANASAICCSRKRQRGREHQSEMEIDILEGTSGVTPRFKAQLQVRSPTDGTGFKRLRCGTQEASTMLSVRGCIGGEEVS